MGWFSNLFGRRDPLDFLNPLHDMKLREFAVVDDDPGYIKHYFKFSNSGEQNSFIVVYELFNSDLIYRRTLGETPGWQGFQTLSERGPWSMTISHLMDLGQKLAATTRPTKGHLASKIPADPLHATNRPSASANTPRPSSPPPKSRSMADAAPWQVTSQAGSIDGLSPRDEISRLYSFSGGSGPNQPNATLRISLTLEADADGRSQAQGVMLHRRLRFYLTPFRLPHEAPFVLRLTTANQAKGGRFEVLASPLDPGGDTAVIARFGAISDVATILDALSLGQHLNFQLEDETETLVRFHLANDMEFKRLYDVSAERIASTRIAHGVVRSQVSQPSRPTFSQLADRARQNPTGHAIWMVEPEPRDYQVWLVHLDASGTKMADSWTLNTFNNRREQGAYGLDVARDLRIKLIDVVDNK